MDVAISLEGVHVIDSREKVPLAHPGWELGWGAGGLPGEGVGPLPRPSRFPWAHGWPGGRLDGWSGLLSSNVPGAFGGIQELPGGLL